MTLKRKIAVLAGDGIGPEVIAQSQRVISAIAETYGHQFEFKEALIGGAAYEEFQSHCPKDTIEICKNSDAILFGSVGGPISEANEAKWKNCEANSILALRKTFSFNAN